MSLHLKVVLGLNATAASLFIVFGCARHLPLEAFPTSWRKEIARWRKAHSRRANRTITDHAEKKKLTRSSPFDVTNRDSPFKAWPAFNEDTVLAAAAGLTRRQRLELRRHLSRSLAATICGARCHGHLQRHVRSTAKSFSRLASSSSRYAAYYAPPAAIVPSVKSRAATACSVFSSRASSVIASTRC